MWLSIYIFIYHCQFIYIYISKLNKMFIMVLSIFVYFFCICRLRTFVFAECAWPGLEGLIFVLSSLNLHHCNNIRNSKSGNDKGELHTTFFKWKYINLIVEVKVTHIWYVRLWSVIIMWVYQHIFIVIYKYIFTYIFKDVYIYLLFKYLYIYIHFNIYICYFKVIYIYTRASTVVVNSHQPFFPLPRFVSGRDVDPTVGDMVRFAHKPWLFLPTSLGWNFLYESGVG